MDDTAATTIPTGSFQTPAISAAVVPAKPETWEQEAWDLLVEAEQWVVADLHDIGIIFTQDIWPSIKAALSLFASQEGTAILGAIVADVTDPALIPAAVGSALLLTASTKGVTDAKQALASATAAVQADPTVQALLAPPAAP